MLQTSVTLTLNQGHSYWHTLKDLAPYYRGAVSQDCSSESLCECEVAGIYGILLKFSGIPATFIWKQGYNNWHAKKGLVTYYNGAKFDDCSTGWLEILLKFFFKFAWTAVALTL